MPYSRRRPRVAPTGRISLRLNTRQRDLLIHAADTPKDVGHALHHAPVRDGKLALRVTRHALDALIAVVARTDFPDRRSERELDAFLHYLESRADRFAEPDGDNEEAAYDQRAGECKGD